MTEDKLKELEELNDKCSFKRIEKQIEILWNSQQENNITSVRHYETQD